DEAVPRGGREGLLLLRADLPGPPACPRLPRRGEGGPRVRDPEGRPPRGSGPEEAADPRIEARESARRVGGHSFLFFLLMPVSTWVQVMPIRCDAPDAGPRRRTAPESEHSWPPVARNSCASRRQSPRTRVRGSAGSTPRS